MRIFALCLPVVGSLILFPQGLHAAWDSRFGLPAADSIRAIAISGGNTYVGGSFPSIGNTTAKNVARWDGTNWWVLGSGTNCGVNGVVSAMVVDGGNVYVGGTFTRAGTTNTQCLACWDGSQWTSIGGVRGPGQVKGLSFCASMLYAVGTFTNIAGVTANRIAKWDGVNWSAVVSSGINGLNSEVNAIAVDGIDIYVVGFFDQAGPTLARCIARLSGTNWYALGGGTWTGINGSVYCVAADGNGNVYAGGQFSVLESTNAKNIAVWDGSHWSRMEGLTTNGVSDRVWTITAVGTNVYAGGAFTKAGGTNAYCIARWNNSGWSVLGDPDSNGVDNAVNAIAVDGNDLYAGGGFQRIGNGGAYGGGQPGYGFARYDGEWHPIDTGNKGVGSYGSATIKALSLSGGNLFAGGSFNAAGGTNASSIARWDGSTWWPLGSGDSNGLYGNDVKAIGIWSGKVYAAGEFTTAGGLAATNIAVWDGTNWSPVGVGVGLFVSGHYIDALAFLGSNLYAGGNFRTAGTVPATNVACWDGSAWKSLGNDASNGINGYVFAMAAMGTNIYAGGFFSIAGGVTANNMAKWDGSRWSALSGISNGIYGSVRALVVEGTNLYIGGGFGYAGGIEATNIARWNDSGWSTVGSGVGARFFEVYALTMCGTNLIAGGDFTNAGTVAAVNIAKWNGTTWSSLDEGADGNPSDPFVYALAASNSSVYVGGHFNTAGLYGSYRFAIWHEGSIDTDGDSLPDTWELDYFGCLTAANNTSDVDGDHFLDLFEYLANTIPIDSNSLLLATALSQAAGNGMAIQWASASNRIYTLSRSTNLPSGQFAGIVSNIAALPPLNTATDITAVGSGPFIYRIDLQ